MLIEKVDQAALHQLDDTAPEAGGSHRPGDREPDHRLVLRQKHLVGEDSARFAKPRGVESLESFLYQVSDVGAPTRPVIADWLA